MTMTQPALLHYMLCVFSGAGQGIQTQVLFFTVILLGGLKCSQIWTQRNLKILPVAQDLLLPQEPDF